MIFPRTVIGRVAIYVIALLAVIWLLRGWERLMPAERMAVLEVRQAERWKGLTARTGEKMLIICVRIRMDGERLERWGPVLFRLEDEDGRWYRPLDDSPLLSTLPRREPAGPVEGELLFRVPAAARARSLSFLPEGWEHADSADHQSEDIGPQGGS
jgi:hypothetical protein